MSFDPASARGRKPSAAPPLLTTSEEKLEVSLKRLWIISRSCRSLTIWHNTVPKSWVGSSTASSVRMSELLIGSITDSVIGGQGRGCLKSLGAKRGSGSMSWIRYRSGRAARLFTSIRRPLRRRPERAAEGLGRPYSLSGTVWPVTREVGSSDLRDQPGAAFLEETPAAGRCLCGDGADHSLEDLAG